jgi:hypothetical protein
LTLVSNFWDDVGTLMQRDKSSRQRANHCCG